MPPPLPHTREGSCLGPGYEYHPPPQASTTAALGDYEPANNDAEHGRP